MVIGISGAIRLVDARGSKPWSPLTYGEALQVARRLSDRLPWHGVLAAGADSLRGGSPREDDDCGGWRRIGHALLPGKG